MPSRSTAAASTAHQNAANAPTDSATIKRTDRHSPTLPRELRREHRLLAQTVYECPSCQDRFLGERRCSDCNLWCRKVGLGGQCSGCDEVLTVSDLIGFDLNSKEVTHI